MPRAFSSGVKSGDAELVARLANGEAAAFEAIYERHRKGVFGFLARLCGDRVLAEDLFQATWLKLLSAKGRLRAESDLRAWLFTVARNQYRSHQRWRRLDLTRLLEFAAEPPASPTEPNGELRQLERALSRLNTSDREVLLLVGVEGFAPEEAARVLAISHATLRKRLSRARARLSEQLAEKPK